MRDHSLVCFRIDRGSGVKGDFGVEADDGSGNILSLTVSKFFFSNIPLQEDPIEFKVWKIGEVGDTVRFKYQSDDWDNNHLYVFQLDSKRQLSGEEYTLEEFRRMLDDSLWRYAIGGIHELDSIEERSAEDGGGYHARILYYANHESLMPVDLIITTDDKGKFSVTESFAEEQNEK